MVVLLRSHPFNPRLPDPAEQRRAVLRVSRGSFFTDYGIAPMFAVVSVLTEP